MKFFEEFVNDIVVKWRKDKKRLVENYELGGLVNREYGDKAELFVKRRIEVIKPKYEAFITSGSQTPADIFSVARRNGYWHIMLVQVKSSNVEDNIYVLNDEDKNVFDIFAKYVKQQFLKISIF